MSVAHTEEFAAPLSFGIFLVWACQAVFLEVGWSHEWVPIWLPSAKTCLTSALLPDAGTAWRWQETWRCEQLGGGVLAADFVLWAGIRRLLSAGRRLSD